MPGPASLQHTHTLTFGPPSAGRIPNITAVAVEAAGRRQHSSVHRKLLIPSLHNRTPISRLHDPVANTASPIPAARPAMANIAVALTRNLPCISSALRPHPSPIRSPQSLSAAPPPSLQQARHVDDEISNRHPTDIVSTFAAGVATAHSRASPGAPFHPNRRHPSSVVACSPASRFPMTVISARAATHTHKPGFSRPRTANTPSRRPSLAVLGIRGLQTAAVLVLNQRRRAAAPAPRRRPLPEPRPPGRRRRHLPPYDPSNIPLPLLLSSAPQFHNPGT